MSEELCRLEYFLRKKKPLTSKGKVQMSVIYIDLLNLVNGICFSFTNLFIALTWTRIESELVRYQINYYFLNNKRKTTK